MHLFGLVERSVIRGLISDVQKRKCLRGERNLKILSNGSEI